MEKGKPNEPSYNFRHKCYKIRQVYWGKGKTYVWDKIQQRVVPMEERKDIPPVHKDIIGWNPEWTYMATGKRMSKKQLKQYCKEKNKIWENS